MSLQPNHYEALGLPPTATAEQIKRKYREMARRYHPDVNPSPDAAHKILSVNQAYQVLGDANRRAEYDAERARQQTVTPPGRPAAPPNNASRPRRAKAQPATPRGPVYYDGFGRSYSPPKSEQRTPSPGPARSKQTPESQQANLEQMLTEAKLAFINREFPLARRLCQDVLKINPREAIAHEILGDIYAREGESQRASTAFAYAIQFNPRNQSAQVKLERLMRAAAAPAGGPSITYTRPSFRGPAASPTSAAGVAIITLLACALLLAPPLLLAINPGNPAADGMGGLFGLSINLLAAIAVAGTASGVLLAFYGRMRPFAQELWSRTREDGSPLPVPLGAMLGLFAIVWFYASFLVYIGVSAHRNRFSPSILRAYVVTFGLVVLFSFVYRPAMIANATLFSTLLVGNLAFPAVLFGWLMGDAIRLRGRI
jgi:curved DNA-binding protein CbpA